MRGKYFHDLETTGVVLKDSCDELLAAFLAHEEREREFLTVG